MSPESPELSEHGRQTITALLGGSSGIPLTKAVEHKVQVRRESAEGVDTIAHAQELTNDEVVMVDMREVVSGTDKDGQRLPSDQDMLVTIFDMVNMFELER